MRFESVEKSLLHRNRNMFWTVHIVLSRSGKQPWSEWARRRPSKFVCIRCIVRRHTHTHKSIMFNTCVTLIDLPGCMHVWCSFFQVTNDRCQHVLKETKFHANFPSLLRLNKWIQFSSHNEWCEWVFAIPSVHSSSTIIRVSGFSEMSQMPTI